LGIAWCEELNAEKLKGLEAEMKRSVKAPPPFFLPLAAAASADSARRESLAFARKTFALTLHPSALAQTASE